MKKIFAGIIAAVLFGTAAYAQSSGTVANHAFAIGKGPNVSGYTSLLCASGQLAIGSATDPVCRTVSGDGTLSAAGVLALATVNANVGAFGSATQCPTLTVNGKGLTTAASQTACTVAVGSISGLGAGIATALAIAPGNAGAPVLFNGVGGTPSSIALANGTGLPIGTGVSGLGTGCATFLGTPSSANLRGCLSDETGTGLAYFQGGDIGTPSAGVGTNLTALNATNLSSGTVAAARGGAGAVNGVLAGNGAGAVSQGTCAGLSGAAASCATDTTNATNISSGTVAAARMPALTGACTTTTGAVATTCLVNTTIVGGGATNSIVAGATGWVGVGLICNGSESFCFLPQPQTGTVGNFYVNVNAAPGAAQTYTVTMRKNSVNQTVTCTISGASATSCNDTTHTFTVAAADNVSVQIAVSAGGATVAVGNFGFKLVTTSP